jgi:DNA topoisomerase I
VGKSLVIVESPAKAGTITKFLGAKYLVKASMGHVRDLPKNKIGVDEKTFKPTYETLPGRKKVMEELKKHAAKADAIYLAPDPDREGEAICWHLAQELKGSKKKIFRVMFNEITKRAILHAMENPGVIDQNKVDAQQARRILDRLVGYKISPLLWDKVRRGLSAGRVQSVALRMIVERERERLAFKPEEYWSLAAKLEADEPPPFEARLTRRDGKKFEVHTKDEMDEVLGELGKKPSWKVTEVVAKEKRKNPAPPFITSKLQQEASRRYGFTVKKTMMLAQRLYEGMDLGEQGTVGLITYMRTDSTRVSAEALSEVRAYIKDTYGKEYVPDEPRTYAVRKQAQEAHEAIRPTSLELTPERVRGFLSKDELNLYVLIWKRFVASQMETAVYDTTTADIEAGRYLFRANGAVVKFPGWLSAYQNEEARRKEGEEDDTPESDRRRSGEDEPAEEGEGLLPPLAQGQVLALQGLEPAQHFTQPPPRFSEAMLVKALEENGIGRPSTYASILATIQTREYVEKDKGRFFPSELGMLVSDLLVESFPDIIDVEYTAKMEEELDEIEEGRLKWVEALKEFNTKFAKDLKIAAKQMRNVKTEETPTEQVCGKCGKPMVVKWGRYGKFLACSGYPECRNTAELKDKEAAGGDAEPAAGEAASGEPLHEETCEKCGKSMVVRRGRFGQFLACTGYPACKNTRRIHINAEGEVVSKKDRLLDEPCPQCGKQLAVKHGRFGEFTACSNYPECRYIKLKEVGVACPKDAGAIVERRSKRGKTFYGCNNYPDCDFVVWYRPVARPCPKCNATFLMEKKTKREGEMLVCATEECGYKIPAETISA